MADRARPRPAPRRPPGDQLLQRLFVGNACAGLTTLALFGPRRIALGVRRSSGRARWMLGHGAGRRGALVMTAATLQGLAACLARLATDQVSVRVFVFVRNLGSAVAFFAIAVALYGFEHFADAFAPGLWGAMLVYGLVVIAVGQVAWYHALKTMPAGSVAGWSMIAPPVAVLVAWLLLGEVPRTAQIVGGAIIAAGVIVAARTARGAEPGPPSHLVEKSLAAA